MKEGTPLVVFCCCFQDSADPRVTPSWDPAGGGVIGPAQPGLRGVVDHTECFRSRGLQAKGCRSL